LDYDALEEGVQKSLLAACKSTTKRVPQLAAIFNKNKIIGSMKLMTTIRKGEITFTPSPPSS
jgi:hypothetical protein